MKLRNKKTGDVVDLSIYGIEVCIRKEEHPIYYSIAKLNEEWEDYKWYNISTEPKEPLIKDEKIRKAVRAWAEADDLDNFRVQNQHFNACKIIGYTAGINKASFIGFQTTIAHADNKKLYDITELCGEEEE